MTREMADACDPGHLPPGLPLYAHYVDGRCVTPPPSRPGVIVGISSVASNAGTVGDCEPGNPRPASWVQWVLERRALGVDPTIYCAHDSEGDFFLGFRLRDVRAAFQAAGVPEPHYWVTLPGATSIPDEPGVVAVQVALGIPPGWDRSIVADHWPGVDPAPDPPRRTTVDNRFSWIRNSDQGSGEIAIIDHVARTYVVLDGSDYLAHQAQAAAAGVPAWQDLAGATFGEMLTGLVQVKPGS